MSEYNLFSSVHYTSFSCCQKFDCGTAYLTSCKHIYDNQICSAARSVLWSWYRCSTKTPIVVFPNTTNMHINIIHTHWISYISCMWFYEIGARFCVDGKTDIVGEKAGMHVCLEMLKLHFSNDWCWMLLPSIVNLGWKRQGATLATLENCNMGDFGWLKIAGKERVLSVDPIPIGA